MDHRSPIDVRATSLMLLLCVIWATQQVALKATAADFSPILQTSLRCGFGAVLVTLFVLVRRRGGFSHPEATFWPGALAGLLFASEFLLAAIAIEMTSVSHLIVLLYTAPIFAALGLALFLPNERLSRLQWVGVVLAFCGIAIAFWSPSEGGLSDVFIGDMMALLAGAIWGATTVVVRVSNLTRAPASLTLIYQLVACFLLLLGVAWFTDDMRFTTTPLVITSFTFQVVVVSFFSYLTWFWLLKNYLASRLGVFSFLTPLLGVVLSVWLLDESFGPRFVLGALLVVTGITLVSAHAYLATKLGFAKKYVAKQT